MSNAHWHVSFRSRGSCELGIAGCILLREASLQQNSKERWWRKHFPSIGIVVPIKAESWNALDKPCVCQHQVCEGTLLIHKLWIVGGQTMKLEGLSWEWLRFLAVWIQQSARTKRNWVRSLNQPLLSPFEQYFRCWSSSSRPALELWPIRVMFLCNFGVWSNF